MCCQVLVRLECLEKEWNLEDQQSPGEHNVMVNGVDVLHELITVFCPFDDKGVIHILKPHTGWMKGLS